MPRKKSPEDKAKTLYGMRNAAEDFAVHGIHTALGSRQEVIIIAMRSLHRAGVCHEEIGKKVDQMIAKSKKTDQARLTEAAGTYLEQILGVEKEVAKMETAIFKALGQGKVENEHIGTATKRLFARILSRAKHCYEPGGGALSQEQIAECMEFPNGFKALGSRTIHAMFRNCEDAGLLISTGERHSRRYQLIQPS
jgi:hypothetical protein